MVSYRTRHLLICISLYIFIIFVKSNVEGRLSYGLLGDKRFRTTEERACEGYPIVLRCPGTDVIEVVSAQYGRQSTEICATLPKSMENTDCLLPEALEIMTNKCNNQTQCKVTVSEENFPDPCSETHKYLEVSFLCVKYMFGCPGTLTGIGTNQTFTTSMPPEAGSWSKDSVYNPDHIFFIHNSQLVVQEYESTEQFLQGEPIQMYNLKFPIAGTSYVVHDGNLYYIKKHSRQILKFNFRARIRMRERTIPGQMKQTGLQHTTSNSIQLAIDEHGLWAIYTNVYNSEHLVISKINKNTLQLEQTWRTTYPQNTALHTFMICGVLYVVSSHTGNIEYMYNTNVDSSNGRSVNIGFDTNRPYSLSDPIGLRSGDSARVAPRRMFSHPAGLRSKSRSFRNYNITSLMYNPRERLLYAWEANAAKAIFYNLHFGLPDPVEGDKPTTTTTTTRQPPTSMIHTLSTELIPSSSTLFPNTPQNPTLVHSSIARCYETFKSGLRWPAIKGGEVQRVLCPAGTDGFGEWKCVIDQSTFQAQWAELGPDITQCNLWINGIEARLQNGEIDPITAANALTRGLLRVSQDEETLSSNEIANSARLLKEITSNALDASTSIDQTQAMHLADKITASANILLEENNKINWENLDEKERYESANNIMSSIEEASLVVSRKRSQFLLQKQQAIQDSSIIAKSDVLVDIRVVLSNWVQPMKFPNYSNFQSSSQWLNDAEEFVVLPETIDQSGEEVTSLVFILYNNLGDFVSAKLDDSDVALEEEWKIDSRVISASVLDSRDHNSLNPPVHLKLTNKQVLEAPRKCVYWNYSQRERLGKWSTEGCQVLASNATHTECSCDHLTSFAVLVNVAGTKLPSSEHELALSIVSSIGISISLLCLLVCIYTFTAFRNLQNDRNTIHKHLCLSLFVAEALFLVGINQTFNRIPCAVIAGLLHYTFLAAFMWMALEGFQLYVMLVEVFEGHSRWKWYYLIGYGIPAVIVGVSAAVDSDGYGDTRACWLKVDSGFIWSFVGPVVAVILCNLIFLSITVFKMYRHSITYTDVSKVKSVKAAVRGASALLFLLGITWAFGIVWVWEQAPIMAYIFCVCNAFQGLYIFVFHCVLQKKVRSEYSRWFERSSCCRKRTRESYVSNSISFSKQYTPARYATATTHGSALSAQTTCSQGQLQRMWNEAVVGTNTAEIVTSPNIDTMQQRDQSCVNVNRRCGTMQQSSTSQLTSRETNDSINFMDNNVRDHSHENDLASQVKRFGCSREQLVGQIAEDAYDHLQRHCHPDECLYKHDAAHSCTHNEECTHVHHANACRAAAFNHQPRLYPISKTINHKALQCRDRGFEKEDVSLLRSQEMQRASTLSNPAVTHVSRDWENNYPASASRRFSQPARTSEDICSYHLQDTSQIEGSPLLPSNPSTPSPTCYDIPKHTGKFRATKPSDAHWLRPIRKNTQRRSIASSESDDPIVNDFSASSSAGSSCGNAASLTRAIGGRQSLISSAIAEDQNAHRNYDTRRNISPQIRHADGSIGLYRDENDLEVQRLTEPVPIKCKEYHRESYNADSQRDSAFCQSTPDLNCNLGVQYNVTSGTCNPETDSSLSHRHYLKSTDENKHRYVMTPLSISQEIGQSRKPDSENNVAKGEHRHSTLYGDSAGFNTSADVYCNGGQEPSERKISTLSNGQDYSHDYESKAVLDATGRMMTCL